MQSQLRLLDVMSQQGQSTTTVPFTFLEARYVFILALHIPQFFQICKESKNPHSEAIMCSTEYGAKIVQHSLLETGYLYEVVLLFPLTRSLFDPINFPTTELLHKQHSQPEKRDT